MKIDLSSIATDIRITVPLAVVVAIIGSLFAGQSLVINWLGQSFVSRDEMVLIERRTATALAMAQNSTKQLSDFLVRQEVRDISRSTENSKDALEDLRLWETANGENAQSRLRRYELTKRIATNEERKRCILEGRTYCD